MGIEVVGLPSMKVVEKATQAPALPPGWVPGAPPEAPAAPDAGEEAAESAGGGDMANRAGRNDWKALVRHLQSDGYVPAGRP